MTDSDDVDVDTTPDAPPAGAGGKPDTGRTDWRKTAEDAQAALDRARTDSDKWKSLARKHEDAAKANRDAAAKTKTVEEQLAEMQQRLADREASEQQVIVDRAVESLTARLIRAGMSDADAADLAGDINPARLLADGKPDPKAIGALAARLAKTAGRPTPDPDQGRKNGSAPADMNTLIRQAAGRV